ncbi:cobalamin biosynthesis protein [Salinivibrio sp. PR5]|uniref:cobalamin biosynthesis protein n=1 Tax=Salinivibrio sp. PR5 TaxID=1909484 RepID=UPI00098B4990|nr:cobalamin biosynthesis protein [Salinivibrio sp. PR5]
MNLAIMDVLLNPQYWLTMAANHPSFWALWLALLIHWLLPLSANYSPFQYWQQYALILADQVNQTTDPKRQRKLAGGLALALMCGTLAILLIATRELVWFRPLFDALLLWLALDWRNIDTFSQAFADAIEQHDKGTARALLANRVNRETESLSIVGLGKAGAETILLGTARHAACVIFYFVLFGGVGALLYASLVRLARVWSPSRLTFYPFGLAVARLLNGLDYIPMRLFALLFALGRSPLTHLKACWQQGQRWRTPGPGWLLACASSRFQLSLGGPAIYQGTKTLRTKIGSGVTPACYHLLLLRQKLRVSMLIWIAFSALCLLIV